MAEVKALCDPAGILNPGIIVGDDDRAHLRHLKSAPAVQLELDRCVECGYCEPVCPSRNTTTTPRQRITLLREIELAGAEGRAADRRALEEAYDYQAIQTCAADSLCVTACPVSIDTGKVMKSFRADQRGPAVQVAGAATARAWGPVTAGLRGALRAAQALPDPVLPAVTRGVRAVVGEKGRDWVPQVPPDLPGPGQPRRRLHTDTGPAQSTADARPSRSHGSDPTRLTGPTGSEPARATGPAGSDPARATGPAGSEPARATGPAGSEPARPSEPNGSGPARPADAPTPEAP